MENLLTFTYHWDKVPSACYVVVQLSGRGALGYFTNVKYLMKN